MRIEISKSPFLPVLAAAALSMTAVQPAAAQTVTPPPPVNTHIGSSVTLGHDTGGANFWSSSTSWSGPANVTTFSPEVVRAAVAQMISEIQSGELTLTYQEILGLAMGELSDQQKRDILAALKVGLSSTSTTDGDRDALLLSSAPTSGEGETRMRDGAGLRESLRALGNIVAPSQDPVDLLVETLDGLLGPSPYPGQLAQAVGFFNMVVDGAPASYLANPPGEFVAIHAILARMSELVTTDLAGSN